LGEEQQTSSSNEASNQGRLAQLLHHCVAFNDALEISEKEDILVELIILSHHRLAYVQYVLSEFPFLIFFVV
jgi:hypothetical protein